MQFALCSIYIEKKRKDFWKKVQDLVENKCMSSTEWVRKLMTIDLQACFLKII